jgi:hypothetical protein
VFTRLRIPQLTGDAVADVRTIIEHFRNLEGKGVLAIDEAAITASQGIKFPATQVTSTDANTLDDYEEGTWTPTDGSGAGLTFTVDHATYTKVGRLVHIQTKLTFPATASGALSQINGLPFSAAKQTATTFGALAGTATWGLISGTSINPEPPAGGGIANAVYTGSTIWIMGTYYT